MARKDKDLAGFTDVANDDNKKNNTNANINNDVNDKDNNNVHEDELNKNDFLGQLFEESKKKDEPVLVGVYLDRDVAKALDRLGKKGGRGMKSRIVNENLKKLFKESGYL